MIKANPHKQFIINYIFSKILPQKYNSIDTIIMSEKLIFIKNLQN